MHSNCKPSDVLSNMDKIRKSIRNIGQRKDIEKKRLGIYIDQREQKNK